MEFLLPLLDNEAVIAAIASGITAAILWILSLIRGSRDEKIAVKVADKLKEKLDAESTQSDSEVS